MRKNLPPEEERFLKNAISMINAVHHGVEKLSKLNYKVIDPSTIQFVLCIISSPEFDKHLLITKFIEKSHKDCWDKIKDRDELYFVDNAHHIFDDLPSTELVDMFRNLYMTKDQNGNSIIEQGLKEDIWDLFDAMIKISIKYIHKKRMENNNIFSDVDLNHHAQLWKVIL